MTGRARRRAKPPRARPLRSRRRRPRWANSVDTGRAQDTVMRALVITFILVVATPHTSLAQGDAAMAAARAATGSQVGKPAANKAKASTPPAAPAEKPAASEPAADAPAPVVATPADAAASPALQARGFAYNPEGRRDPFVNL